ISGFVQQLTGRLKAVDGPLSEATQHITSSISIFTAVGDRFELGRSHLELAAVLVKGESYEKARYHVRQSMEIFVDLGARLEIERARRMEELIASHLSIRSGTTIMPQSEQVSELSLIKRLGQACITSEILLQEFSAIAFESFRLRKLVIFQRSSEPQSLLLARGFG